MLVFIPCVISLLLKDLLFRKYLSSLQLVLSACVAALNVSSYFMIVQIIYSGPLGSMMFRIYDTTERSARGREQCCIKIHCS